MTLPPRRAARDPPSVAAARIHGDRPAHAGARGRREHRDLQRRLRHAARAAALRARRSHRHGLVARPGTIATAAPPATYEEWKRRSRSFDGLAAWTGRSVSLAEPGQRPDQVQARLGTPGFCHDPRVQDDARPRLPARGRRARQGSGGHPRQPLLAGRASAAMPRSSARPSASTASPTRSSACSRRARRIAWKADCSCRSRSRPSSSITTSTGCS